MAVTTIQQRLLDLALAWHWAQLRKLWWPKAVPPFDRYLARAGKGQVREIEQSEPERERLDALIAKLDLRLVVDYWLTPEDLATKARRRGWSVDRYIRELGAEERWLASAFERDFEPAPVLPSLDDMIAELRERYPQHDIIGLRREVEKAIATAVGITTKRVRTLMAPPAAIWPLSIIPTAIGALIMTSTSAVREAYAQLRQRVSEGARGRALLIYASARNRMGVENFPVFAYRRLIYEGTIFLSHESSFHDRRES